MQKQNIAVDHASDLIRSLSMQQRAEQLAEEPQTCSLPASSPKRPH
jgi:hypothetical protein